MPAGDRAPGAFGRWWSSLGRSPERGATDGPAAPADPLLPAERAVVAFAAMDDAFGVRRTPSLFREATGRAGQRYAFLWPFSRAAAAALDLAERGAVPVERVVGILGDGLACYLRPEGVPPAYDSAVRPPLGSGGDRFYDDNAWIGLDLVRLHRLTGDQAALDRAAAVFAFLVSGWDDDPGRPHPGGVAWVENRTNTDRNTVSTAPAAQLGYLLARLGAGDDPGGARAWADRMLGWVHGTLRDPADGLYWDHIDAAGTVERTKWSYNQGNVIGAELAHHALGPDGGPGGSGSGTGPLGRAEALAVASLDHYEAASGGLAAQGLPFNAVFLRNLLDLRAVCGGPLGARIHRTAVAVAAEAWRERCGADGLVRRGPRGSGATLVDQAAMVEIQALAAAAEDRPPDVPPDVSSGGDGTGGGHPPSSTGSGTG